MTPIQAHEYLEDFQRIMTQHREAYSKKLIEANGQAILALEKQIPKKIIIQGFDPKKYVSLVSYFCPVCHTHISRTAYCSNCGQALLWGDSE